MAKAEPMIMPSCMKVESNKVFMRNRRRMGPISFVLLSNVTNFKLFFPFFSVDVIWLRCY